MRRQQRLYSAQTQATHAQSIVGWGRQTTVSETSSAETSAAPSPSPAAQITGNNTDPFAYLETPDDAWWSQSAFRYAVDGWLPLIFEDLSVLDKSLPASDSCLATIDRIIQGCLENRMHMFALLAASSGHMKFVLKLQLDRRDTPEYCMGKALQHLRHHLASTPRLNESLIFDLQALSTFERYVGNFEGARTHFNMVQHLVQLTGGFDILEPPMRLLCWLWDLLVAGGTGESPLMPLTWDPGSFSSRQMRDEILPDLAQSGVLPSGSGLLQYAPALQPELNSLVNDTVQWFQVQQYNHVHNFAKATTGEWAARRSYALVHRLLSLSAPSSGDSLRGMLSESTKQGMLLSIADMQLTQRARTATGSNGATSFLSWSGIDRLHLALSTLITSTEDWQEQHEEVVLWMACLGIRQSAVSLASAPSSHAGDEPDDHGEWFVSLAKHILADRLARTRSCSRAAKVDELLQIISRYLHHCEPSGRPSIDGLEVAIA